MEKVEKKISDPLENNNEFAVWEVKDIDGFKNFALFFNDGLSEILIFQYEFVGSKLKPSLKISEEFFNTFSETDQSKLFNQIKILEGYVLEEHHDKLNPSQFLNIQSRDWKGLISAIESFSDSTSYPL